MRSPTTAGHSSRSRWSPASGSRCCCATARRRSACSSGCSRAGACVVTVNPGRGIERVRERSRGARGRHRRRGAPTISTPSPPGRPGALDRQRHARVGASRRDAGRRRPRACPRAGRRGRDAHQRDDRSAQADPAHVRDALAGARRRQALREQAGRPSCGCARASPSSTRRWCTSAACSGCCSASNDGRSFCLLETFRVDELGRCGAPPPPARPSAWCRPRCAWCSTPTSIRPTWRASGRSCRARRRSHPTTPTRSSPSTGCRCCHATRRPSSAAASPAGTSRTTSVTGRPSAAASAGPTRAASCASSTRSRATPLAAGRAEGLLEVQGAPARRRRWPGTARPTWRGIDADGFLWILGRADQAIIRGGFKVRPDDVRAALERDPRVRGAAVVGMDDPRLGAVPGRGGRAAAGLRRRSRAEELLADASKVLARYELPTELRIVDDAAAHPVGQGRPRGRARAAHRAPGEGR